jgi:23S rRNA pseudouridine2605 synthase
MAPMATTGKQKTTGKKKTSDKVRLQVLLARCGLGSRRACEDFITTGRVTVDGELVTELGVKVDVIAQKIEVDGESIRPDRAVCYMVNKPKGMLCTNSDPSGRARVIDLFPASAGRLFPIGRLDENSVGLLLVTNDGDLGHRLAHPRFKVPKIYEVQVAGRPTREIMQQLRQGMYFSDGRFKVDNAKITGSRGKSTILEVTLSEGRNREIRRLFSRVGHKVMKLERVAFGPLRLRSVTVGKYRQLSREEMKLLHDYIENGERRVNATADTPKSKPSSEKRGKAPRSDRKAPERRVVEIGPVSTTGGRDMTGRKRTVQQPSGKQSGRILIDDDDDSVDVSTHPAIVGPKKTGGVAAKKPRTRKAAVRRPVTVTFETTAVSDGDSALSARSGKSRRSNVESADVGKVSGKRSASRKKEAKAKNSSKRRKRR